MNFIRNRETAEFGRRAESTVIATSNVESEERPGQRENVGQLQADSSTGGRIAETAGTTTQLDRKGSRKAGRGSR